MSGEQVLLDCLQNLDLEATKSKKTGAAEDPGATAQPKNPFAMHRRRSKSLSSINFGAKCHCQKKNLTVRHTISFKKPNKKILRDPILKFIKCSHDRKPGGDKKQRLFGHSFKHKTKDFRTVIDACANLNLNTSSESQCFNTSSFLRVQNRGVQKSTLSRSESQIVNSTCSHQALMNAAAPPCDVTIDELASYFETFVHIPKKMSSMAEMMYI